MIRDGCCFRCIVPVVAAAWTGGGAAGSVRHCGDQSGDVLARVVINMGHDVFTGTIPTGLPYMQLNHWWNEDLLPGVKVDQDVQLQLSYLTQDGWAHIQP
jgi:hypothetical protein